MASLLRRVLKRERVGVGRRRLQVRPRRRRRATLNRCDDEDKKIRRFRRWCRATGLVLHSHLYIGRMGSCADIGVVAKATIARDTVLAEIPRHALLSATTSRVGPALLSDGILCRQLKTANSWIPLLLALLAECGDKTCSYWWPYLSLVPSEGSPGPALQWASSERERLLEGTRVREWVERDRDNITRDYRDIVLPFMQRHPKLYEKTSQSLQFYQQLVCFVMAYSFTDSEERDMCAQTMMVPFVDLLNHHSHHHVELRFHTDHLELVAVRDIDQGSEVMNTYGPLSNASLLHVYGFAEKGNPHDVALIHSSIIQDVYTSFPGSHDKSHDQRWERLVDDDMIEEEFEVDSSGWPESSLLAVVKLLLARETEYEHMRDTILAEDEDLILDGLSKVEWQFIHKVCEATLAKFPEDLVKRSGEEMMAREHTAWLLVSGQQRCLAQLESRARDNVT